MEFTPKCWDELAPHPTSSQYRFGRHLESWWDKNGQPYGGDKSGPPNSKELHKAPNT